MMMSKTSATSTHMQHIASDLNEQAPNRYELVLQISDIAKRLKENQRERQRQDALGLISYDEDEKVIYQALMMKASELGSGEELIG
jgi:DNA-directed RNA polymerase subunit K/omega